MFSMFIMFNMHVHACMHTCVCVCACVHGTCPTHPYPPLSPIHHSPGGGPPEAVKIQ